MWRTKFFIASVIFGLLISFQVINSYAQGSWKIIRQVDTLTIYTDVDFVDKNNGWVVGYIPIAIPEEENQADVIIHTSDGGETWEFQKYKTGYGLYAVDFVDSLHGWALANNGVTLHTKDGGKHWQPDSSLYQEWWEAADIDFVDTLKGWVIGNNPKRIYFTEDAGKTWTLQLEWPERGLGGIFALDSLRAWVTGIGGILHTTDGGRNWRLQYHCSCSLGGCQFIDSSTGWVTGRVDPDGGVVLKTSDGGQNWSPYLIGGFPSDVSFVDSLQGWIVGYYSYVVLHTNDGGNSWIVQQTGLDDMASLHAVCFIDSCIGWAVGYARGELALGTVLKYTCSSSNVNNNTLNDAVQPNTFQLLQNYPNPFNLGTTIQYYTPHSARVSVSIYDVRGRLVKNLISNEMLSRGYHDVHWNGRDQQGNVVSSGVYLCTLQSKGNVKAIKLVVIK